MSFSLAGRKSLVDEWVKAGKANGLHVMVQVGGAPFADVVDLVSLKVPEQQSGCETEQFTKTKISIQMFVLFARHTIVISLLY